MSSRYYAHFIAEADEGGLDGEYSGVVELSAPLKPAREPRELRLLLARNFELDAEDIRILNWAVLH
jgi:hypothetical protein